MTSSSDLGSRESDLLHDFEEFLRTTKYEYWSKITRMSIDGQSSLVVDYKDIYDFDAELAKELASEPETFLNIANTALLGLLSSEDPEYVASFKHPEFYVRIKSFGAPMSINEVRKEHLNKFIHIKGKITAVAPMVGEPTSTLFICRHCAEPVYVEQKDPVKSMTPIQCPLCLKSKFYMAEKGHISRDRQDILLQVAQEDMEGGAERATIVVRLYDDLTLQSKIAVATDVLITGILREVPVPKHISKLTERVLIANSTEALEDLHDYQLSPQDIERIQAAASEPSIHQRLVESICPSIYGYKEIKEAIALQLFGGNAIEFQGSRQRGDIHVLLAGDPSLAKTQLLKWTSTLLPNGQYTSGRGASAAGLTGATIRDEATGHFFVSPGVLVLADNGIACLDELEKMDQQDRQTIHTAIEQQIVHIDKANVHAMYKARCAVLAAINPKLGTWEPSLAFKDNVGLDSPLISRFDLIFVMIDNPELERDSAIFKHMAALRTGNLSHRVSPPFSIEFLRKYIIYARSYVKPFLTQKALEEAERYYLRLRQASSRENNSPRQIAPRQGEALMRIAEARAKMALRPKADVEDIQYAISLFEYTLKAIAFDSTTQKIDIDKWISTMSNAQKRVSTTILKLMEDLATEGKRSVTEEDLVERCFSVGLTKKEEILQAIERLVKDGTLYRNRKDMLVLSQ